MTWIPKLKRKPSLKNPLKPLRGNRRRNRKARIPKSLAHSRGDALTTAHYETDFYLWTKQQAKLLRQGALSDIDTVNLAEEIESMGKSDRRAVWSHLANTIMHLLKWQYQPERRGSSWIESVDNGREQLSWLVKDSPSLRPKLPVFIEDVYSGARRKASRETGLPLATFPDQCPFTVEQITGDYWPV